MTGYGSWECGRAGHARCRSRSTTAPTATSARVGEAIRSSGVAREEVFIETKVWINDYGQEATLHAFEKSADKLKVEQLDLLILHQPVPMEFDRTLDAYRALETLLADGKVRTENFDVFAFELSADEVATIDALDTGKHGGPDPDSITLASFDGN